MKKNILFIGYGDLGSRLASIGRDDLLITGISRSPKPIIVPDQYYSLDWSNNPSQKIDLLKTLRSDEIGLKISISFSSFANWLSIFESVNDQVTDSRKPFDARDLWDKWNSFCWKFKVSFIILWAAT